MSENYVRRQTLVNHRTFTIASIVIRTHQQLDNGSSTNTCGHVARQLATISQICLPFGTEYQPQRRIPPRGPEAQLPFLLTATEDNGNTGEQQFLIATQGHRSTDGEDEEKKLSKTTRRILFLIEPAISGLILFPIVALFWYCGWNLGLVFENYSNHFPLDFNINQTIPVNYGPYSWQSLFYPYLVVQFLLLFYYLFQNLIYNFFEKRSQITKCVLLQCHIFVLATIYIAQWKFVWSVWNQSTPHGWQFEITFSVAALFATVVYTGHLSDLVCSPFLLSYDSIDYCIHFGCSLLTKNVGLISFSKIIHFDVFT